MVEEKAKCEKCGEGIKSEKVVEYSKEHYENHVYCYKCQQKKKDNPDWEYKPPEKDGADAKKKKGTLDDEYSGGEVPNPDSEEIEDIDAIGEENDAELNAELNDEFTALRDKMNAGHVEQLYEWLKSEYGSGTFDELSIEDKRSVIEQTRHLLQQKVADKVTDSKGEEVAGSAKVVDAEIVSNAVDVSQEKGKEEEKWSKVVEIDEGVFRFCDISKKEGRGVGEVLVCELNGDHRWLDVMLPYCDCIDFDVDSNKLCQHLKAAIVAGYDVAKLVEKKKPKKSKVKEESVEAVSERKEISIDWKNIPKQIFVPKWVKALEYVAEWDAETDCFDVKKASGEGASHRTTLKSCDCADCLYRGTSLNPCVHQVRIRYTDEEIRAKLKELGAEELQRAQKDRVISGRPSFSGISELQPRLCETGKIKIGELSEKRTSSGRRLPKKLDHFVITTLLRDEDEKLLLDEEMLKKIGENCKELDIYLCYDSPELNMPTFYAYFTQSKLRCMGDGKTARKTKDDGGKEEITCNPKTCEAYKKKLCKPYGRLSVILSDSKRIGGAYVFRTTSWNTLRNILTSMSFIRTITGGIIAGLPLKMRLIPMQVQPNGLGHTVRIYMVNIEFNGDMKQLMEAADQELKRRLQMGTNMKRIEADSRREIAERVREEAEEQAGDFIAEFVTEGE